MEIYTAAGWKVVGGDKFTEVPEFPAAHIANVSAFVRSRNNPTMTTGWNTKFLHEDPPLILEVELRKHINPPQTPVLDWPYQDVPGTYRESL